jgi:hypothetical protein
MLKSTVLYFLFLSILLVIVPHLIGVQMNGSGRFGFPFTYREFSSAPPPAFGSVFTLWAFAADLAIYLGIALMIAWVRNRKIVGRKS